MKTDAERIFTARVKSMVENTDFEENMSLQIKEEGLDKIPEFEFLNVKRTSVRQRIGRAGNSRLFKIAGFFLAVLVVSGIMTVATNSEFVSASKFRLHSFMFNVQNGFLISDTSLNETPVGTELLIENEEQISVGRNFLKELKIPEYIPDGYSFSNLRIINNHKNEYDVIYVYESEGNNTIVISQTKLADYNREIVLVGIEDELYIEEFKIYYIPSPMSEYKSIYAFDESEMIYISGLLELTDLTAIFEGFR